MPDDFDAQAREELQKLREWRINLRKELLSVTDKINGLKLYLSEQPKPDQPADHAATARTFTPRGTKMKTILSIVKEIHPDGLTVGDIVQRAATLGVELIPASTRSQLSRLKSEGVITSRDGAYSYISPRQPETSGPDLLNQAGPNSTEAPAETEASDQGGESGFV